MATAKKNTYIEEELKFLEERAKEIKESIESVPYNELQDRIVSLMGPNGSSEKVTATIEQQQKAQRDAMKDYAQIIEAINRMREKEESKIQARGDQDIPHRMRFPG